MNKFKQIAFIVILVCAVFATALLIIENTRKSLGAVSPAEATYSTSTPYLANNTVLCSKGGTLDSVISTGPHSGYLWVLNSTSTIHTDYATTSAILAAMDSGYSTTTNVTYGVVAERGIMVNYTGSGTTTITYSCNQ